jgi:NitT/TauT family transport system substrate-binding protein
MSLTRSTLLRLAAGTGIAASLPGVGLAALPPMRGEPEMKAMKIGIAVPDVAYLALYVASAQGLWKNEGLDVELVTFSGDASVTQALAGGSVDMNSASIVGLLNLIQSGQKVKAISSNCNQAVFSFVGNSKVKTWNDLKGGTFGVASYGSVTAALGTVALEEHGIIVGKDIQLVQTGGSPNAYSALESGRLSGSGFSLPYALKAKTAGMNFLGSQVTVTGSQWPAELMYTKVDYLAKNPKTVSAMMRGLAVAAKVIQTQPAVAIKVLQDTMKLEPEIASGSYSIVKDTFLPRGEFPKDMSKIWKVLIAAKTVTAPVPMDQWYDPTWVDNYTAWKPR